MRSALYRRASTEKAMTRNMGILAIPQTILCFIALYTAVPLKTGHFTTTDAWISTSALVLLCVIASVRMRMAFVYHRRWGSRLYHLSWAATLCIWAFFAWNTVVIILH
jgi:hypothetical protein